jgi:YfiH family protein
MAPVLRENHRANADGSDLLYLTFPGLSRLPFARHLITTREGGVSEGMFRSMNLSFDRGDDPERVLENFRRVAAVFDTTPEHMVTTWQTHTVNLRRVTASDAGKGVVRPRDYTDIDGILTDEPGLILGAFFADCVPLLFADPVRRAVGISHSGWRGTVHRMGQVTVERFAAEFGSRPEDLVCAIGPSICRDCYEVSEDVADAFRAEFGADAALMMIPGKYPGKYQLDLQEANRYILLHAGVRPENIEVTDICTCCNPELLFSHRASHGRRGNLGAFLMIDG